MQFGPSASDFDPVVEAFARSGVKLTWSDGTLVDADGNVVVHPATRGEVRRAFLPGAALCFDCEEREACCRSSKTSEGHQCSATSEDAGHVRARVGGEHATSLPVDAPQEPACRSLAGPGSDSKSDAARFDPSGRRPHDACRGGR